MNTKLVIFPVAIKLDSLDYQKKKINEKGKLTKSSFLRCVINMYKTFI